MAALAKLYEFLEKKRDEEHIDSMFCFHMMHFHLKKAPCTAWDSFVVGRMRIALWVSGLFCVSGNTRLKLGSRISITQNIFSA